MENPFEISDSGNYNKPSILSGLGFDNDKGAYLMVDDTSTVPWQRKKYFDIFNKKILLKPVGQRYCIGLYDLPTMQSSPCPTQSIIKNKGQNCLECFKEIGFNPAFYRVKPEKLLIKQQQYNKMPHYVCVAYFSPAMQKVGIAYKPRLFPRLKEQGARAACIVAEFSTAYKARELEQLAINEMSIAEGISTAQKMHILCQDNYNPAIALAKLTELTKEILNLNSKIGDTSSSKLSKECVLNQGKILDFNYEKTLFSIPAYFNFEHSYFLTALTGPFQKSASDHVEGTIKGMVGNILFYENNGDIKLNALQPYIGRYCFTSQQENYRNRT